MQTRWVGKNVNLNSLCERIENFFVGKGFGATRVNTKENIEILCAYKKENKGGCVRITVNGNSEDFLVSFETSIGDERLFKFFSPFLTMMGLGLFWSSKIKLYDFYENLEEQFWTYLDEVVSAISGSASKNR